jgi:hypothetical protein
MITLWLLHYCCTIVNDIVINLFIFIDIYIYIYIYIYEIMFHELAD